MKEVSMFIVMSFFMMIHLGYGQNQNQPNRFVNKYEFSDNLTAVIAEGDYEPRSIGSYSLRIYKMYNAGLPCDYCQVKFVMMG